MKVNENGYGVEWLTAYGKDVHPNNMRVAELVNWWARGIYHVQNAVIKADWSAWWGVELIIDPSGFATFDADGLTRLVVGAHDLAVRVEIVPCSPSRLRIRFSARERTAADKEYKLYARHPTIIEAVRTMVRMPVYTDPSLEGAAPRAGDGGAEEE